MAMKIVSWNVNGLRALYNKGFLNIVSQINPDILCLQEIKSTPEQLPADILALDGYEKYFFPAQRKGYSGVAVFTNVTPIGVVNGLGNEQYDMEGRTITVEFADFFLVNCYVPNAQPELARLPYREAFNDTLKEYMLTLAKKKGVILCGDLNVAHQPIDLKNPKANEHNPGYSIEERRKFDELLHAGMVDVFRHLYPDKVSYTWWSYRFKAREKNIGWRIDYFLSTPDLLKHIADTSHNTDIFGSDHCPITLIASL
jgi:exodeoxyribonuclease-3